MAQNTEPSGGNRSSSRTQPVIEDNMPTVNIKVEPADAASYMATIFGPAFSHHVEPAPSIISSQPIQTLQTSYPPPLSQEMPYSNYTNTNVMNGNTLWHNMTSGPSTSGMNMPLTQPHQKVKSQSKYVKMWTGTLCGRRLGQQVFICKLEGYRCSSALETLGADWPSALQIVRLVAEDHVKNVNSRNYVGKDNFFVFRALNPHGFLGQLKEKKLCGVIQLPHQTLVLSVSEKVGRLIGLLFPEGAVVFRPHVSSQPQQQLESQPGQTGQMRQLEEIGQEQLRVSAWTDATAGGNRAGTVRVSAWTERQEEEIGQEQLESQPGQMQQQEEIGQEQLEYQPGQMQQLESQPGQMQQQEEIGQEQLESQPGQMQQQEEIGQEQLESQPGQMQQQPIKLNINIALRFR